MTAPAHPQRRNDFEIASTESGLNIWYNDDEFTLDEEMQRKLLMFFARHCPELFSDIVCPVCASHSSVQSRDQGEIIFQRIIKKWPECITRRKIAYKDFEGDFGESWTSIMNSPDLKPGDIIQILRTQGSRDP